MGFKFVNFIVGKKGITDNLVLHPLYFIFKLNFRC